MFSSSKPVVRHALVRSPRQAGVTLIEVLVSMLIMALALVSMAALQSSTLKYQFGSNQRAVMSVLLADYAERLRANLDHAATSATAYRVTAAVDAALPTASTDCGQAVCASAADLAAYDMAEWRAMVRRELPNGAVRVTGNPAAGMTVSFMWFDKEFNSVVNTVLGSRTSPVCTSADVGMAQQSCCPVQMAAGVRCATFTVTP